MVAYHRDALSVLAKVIPEFIDRCNNPKAEMHFTAWIRLRVLSWPISSTRNCNREEHDRCDAGFKWALGIENAVNMTESMTLRQVSQQFGKLFPSTFLLPI